MARSNTATMDEARRERSPLEASADTESTSPSAVSWAAIFAGAAGAASLSLILLMLGTGLGLSAVSPWAHEGIGKTTFGVSTILWLTFTQLVASGMGGYLAGRLRTRWVAVHRDEVYFRDTVHGFLAWAMSALVTAALLTSAVGSIANSGVQAGVTVAAATTGTAAMVGSDAVKSDGNAGALGYFIDSLFRRDTAPGAAERTTPELLAEVDRIFMSAIHAGALTAQDVRYVGLLVMQRTGLPRPEAEKRVSDTYARVQARLHDTQVLMVQSADAARKASAYASLWLFISLLGGAFVASLAATAGGRQRDA